MYVWITANGCISLMAIKQRHEYNEPKAKYPFKNDSGQRYSKQLFRDLWVNLPVEGRTVHPCFTLHDDVEGYINFGREYINLEDTTGYKIAMRYFKTYDFWEFLMRSPWFREAKAVWDREIEAKLQAEALTAIRRIAADEEDKGRLSAAKFLYEAAGGVAKKNGPRVRGGAGRPSKEEVQGIIKQEAEDQKSLLSDLERIRAVK
jgi:hypothetical protein